MTNAINLLSISDEIDNDPAYAEALLYFNSYDKDGNDQISKTELGNWVWDDIDEKESAMKAYKEKKEREDTEAAIVVRADEIMRFADRNDDDQMSE